MGYNNDKKKPNRYGVDTCTTGEINVWGVS